MTRLNLMPVELRRKESTPLKILLPAIAMILVGVLLGFAWAWLHFGELSNTRFALAELENTVASKQPQVKYAAALKSEAADFDARTQTIREIANSRIRWTPKLDQLFDVVCGAGEPPPWLVMFENLEVKTGASSPGLKGAAGDTMTVKGRCFDERNPLQRFNLFHDSLTHSEFFVPDFAAINNPAGHSTDSDDGLTPTHAWSVDLTMTMKPPVPPHQSGKPVDVVGEKKDGG